MRRAIVLALTLVAGCKKEEPTSTDTTPTVSVSYPSNFLLVNDSVQFTARVLNDLAQPITTVPVTWSSSVPTVVTVSPNGLVVGRAVGSALITARAGNSTANVTVDVDPVPCGAPLALTVGEVRQIRGARALGCVTLAPATTAQDILYIIGNGRAVQDDTLTYSLGLATAASIGGAFQSRVELDPRDIAERQSLEQLNDFETRLRSFERQQVMAALPKLQAQRTDLTGAGASLSVSAAAVADVGDTVAIRVPNLDPAKQICADHVAIRAVVRAVGRKVTLIEDIASPPGRLSTTDYQEIATEFDNVIYPADTLWFGSPTDLDRDGRVTMVYTPEVNKLTPANATGIVGGFFFGGDLIKKTEYPDNNVCRNQTNEQEIFYLLAPDPQGTINGNARTTAGVRQVTRGTIAHEFQHMINQSVRQYNPAVKAFETAWLNEGMSHFAEEAVGRALRGFTDFQSLNTVAVNPSPTQQNDYLAYFRQNLTRFRFWTLRPDTASPTSNRARNELASRGAAWALVRYVADQYSGGNAKAFFRRLAAGPETDIANLLARANNRPFDEVIGSWLVANYTDGLTISGLNPKYSYSSWEMRDVLSGVNGGTYPLQLFTFPGTFTSQAFSGSGNYYLQRRPAGTPQMTLNLRTPGGAPITSANARVWIVRMS